MTIPFEWFLILAISSTGSHALPYASSSRPKSEHIPRQVAPPPPENTAASSGAEGDSGGSGIAIEVIVPVVVILVAAILLIGALRFRSKLSSFFRSVGFPTSSQAALQPISTRDSFPRTVTADQLSGHNSRVDLSSSNSNTQSGNNANAAMTPAQTRAARRARRDRNVRRTESGRSVKTLPVYSKEAGDEELVLVRQRSESSFSSGSYSDEERDAREGEAGDLDRGPLPSHRRSSSLRSSHTVLEDENTERRNEVNTLSPLAETHESLTPTPTSPSEEIELVTRTPPSTSISLPLPADTPLSTTATTIPDGDTPSPQPQRSESLTRRESLARRSWGLAPTYLEAMSAPLIHPNSSHEEAEAVPPPRNIRTMTSSTFRGLLSRAGFLQQQGQPPSSSLIARQMRERENRNRDSSTSLLLQPTTSRASSSFIRTRSRSPSASTSTTPWESTNSLSLLISSPVPNTAIRASFDSATLPKAGLSEEQMKFLASKDVLSVAGVKMDDVPEYKRRRRSRAGTVGSNMVDSLGVEGEASGSGTSSRRASDASSTAEVEGEDGDVTHGGEELPSWEMSEDARRRNEAFERRNLSKPVVVGDNDHEDRDVNLNSITNTSSSSASAPTQTTPIDTGSSETANEVEGRLFKPNKPIPAPIKVNLGNQIPSISPSPNRGREVGSPSSPSTFMTAPITPLTATSTSASTTTNTPNTATATNTSASAGLTITPRLEVEPPTPIVATPPTVV
ncbi:uncharacterized protein I303_105117 [Kwoniella dejecticola CBS 10117]|uniref:Uncharacterized protein n=1 Tax=Kwoniella dejecticola CBS 10117 TaxID=1296121 RepID=A0A1A6A3F6_9TREE|nr:uncharacterized protein I303_05438 [Kwoniella dejecticola CBS 10117]OBR84579.1 hypothetical protein I303_05438 [Kwoniella dejecticola CBS 10117]